MMNTASGLAGGRLVTALRPCRSRRDSGTCYLLAGYTAYGIGAAGRHAANAVNKLGPLPNVQYGHIAHGDHQIGRFEGPFSRPAP